MKDQTPRIELAGRKIRVCVVANLFPARSETFVLEHVMGLARRGFDVTVIAKDYDRSIAELELERINEAGIKRHYVGSFVSFSTKFTNLANALRVVWVVLRRPKMYGAFRGGEPWAGREILIAYAIWRHIVKNSFDLVHVHFGDLAARIENIARRFESFPPMVVTWHGYDVNAIPRKLGGGVYKKLFESEVRHTVGTGFIFERLLALGARGSHVSKIPMGVDVQRFSYLERSLNEGDKLRVLSIGRLDEVKGHDFLIDAFAKLINMGRDALLRIGGDGPMRGELIKRIKALGLDGQVELLGPLDSDSVIREMHSAHLFALTGIETKTGKVESQGLVLQEAQATGLPVVSSRAGGVPESVLDGQTGVLCEPGNIEEICNAIDRFIQDTSLLSTYGKNGRLNVERKFSSDVMHSRIIGLYGDLLGLRSEGPAT